MELILDEHLKAVLEFMQERIPANKLIGLSERLPEVARLLWDRYPRFLGLTPITHRCGTSH